MAKKTDADQYFEVEVTAPTGQPVYSYLRLGTWNDDLNTGAGTIRDIQEAADGAIGNPSTENVAKLKAAIGKIPDSADWLTKNGSKIDAAVRNRQTEHTARATAMNGYKAARATYQPKADAGEQAYADVQNTKAAYEASRTSGESAAEQAKKLKAYNAAKTTYQTAKTALDAATTALKPAKDALDKAQAAYQKKKGALSALLAQALEKGRSATIADAAKKPVERERGHDLAMQITDFYDDTRKRGTFEHLSVAERQAESAKLHTKGGWRDHTEGNRISTTRGDKIEVVYGNYRRMVMGRQDDADEACLLDASGGLYMDGDFAPGSVVLVEYSTRYGDTWLAVEECTKGHVINKYHGDVEEHYYGNELKSFIGKPGGATWDGAEAIKPDILEQTWAKQITSKVDAKNISENTHCVSMMSILNVDAGMIDINNVGAGLVELRTVGASHIDLTAATTYVEVFAGGLHVGVELSALTIDVFLGMKLEVVVAIAGEIRAGKFFECGPDATELSGGKEVICAMATEVKGGATAMAGKVSSIAGQASNLAASVTDTVATAAVRFAMTHSLS